MGSRAKPPEAGEFSIIFVLKVTLQFVRLLLTASYRTRKLSYRKDDRAMRPMYMGALKIFGSP